MRGAALLLLPALALLAGCVAPNSPQACRIVRVAEAPIVFKNGLVFVDATVEGKPARFELDTGASATLVTDAAANSFRLGYDLRYISSSTGIDALAPTRVTNPARIAIGGHEFDPIPLMAIPAATALDEPSGAVGLLGLNALGKYDLELDIPHRRLTLYEPRQCPDGPSPLPGKSVTLKSPPNPQNYLYVEGRFDGHPVYLVADTGASVTYLNQARLGLPDEAFAADRDMQGKTAGPGRITAHIHTFKAAQVADTTVANARIAVGPMKVEADGLLGNEFWRRRPVWMSFAGRVITFGERATRSGTDR